MAPSTLSVRTGPNAALNFDVAFTSREFLGFVYQNLGVLESQAEHYDASRKLYKEALRLNPKLAAAYYNLGNDFLNQKEYRKVIREYDKALKLYPGDPWALQNRELAREGLAERTKTEEDGGRGEGIDPSFRSPQRLSARWKHDQTHKLG